MGIGNELITQKEHRYAPDANSVRCIFVRIARSDRGKEIPLSDCLKFRRYSLEKIKHNSGIQDSG